MGLAYIGKMAVCVLGCHISDIRESLCVVLSEPDSLRFMVGHCARLIAVADFFKGMQCNLW